jgi:hypothetical protein
MQLRNPNALEPRTSDPMGSVTRNTSGETLSERLILELDCRSMEPIQRPAKVKED